jgi:hypothetical protein
MHSDKGQYLKFTYSLALGGVFSIFSQSDQSVISLYKETGEAGNTLILQNGSDNSGAISEAANSTCNVILENHILHKDGNWNTLCLPFNHGKTGPLADATIMELDTEGKYKYDNEKWEIDATNGTQKTGFNAADGTLYLFFKTAESIEAGKPYIIKWEGVSGDIDSPIFSNVTVSSATSDVTSSDGYDGDITLSMGLDPQGKVLGIAFTTLNETPGMGMLAKEPAFTNQFVGKTVSQFVHNKGGASGDNAIDAISGASTTSGAVVNAVNAGLDFFHSYMQGGN